MKQIHSVIALQQIPWLQSNASCKVSKLLGLSTAIRHVLLMVLTAIMGISITPISANAGQKWDGSVVINKQNNERGTMSAAFGSARNSSNQTEYFYCNISDWVAGCYAVDKNYESYSCYTVDKDLLTVLRSASDGDSVVVYVVAGTCMDVLVQKGSPWAPK